MLHFIAIYSETDRLYFQMFNVIITQRNRLSLVTSLKHSQNVTTISYLFITLLMWRTGKDILQSECTTLNRKDDIKTDFGYKTDMLNNIKSK